MEMTETTAIVPYLPTPVTEIVTWNHFQGYQGTECSCGATHNVQCGIACYFCQRCGKCNTLSWFGNYRMQFDWPDFGPSRAAIKIALYTCMPFKNWKYFGMVEWDDIKWLN